MKIFGKEIKKRGANKKYPELDDLDWLYSRLKTMSITQLAKKLEVPQNSIRHRVFSHFPQEWIDSIVKERKYHSRST